MTRLGPVSGGGGFMIITWLAAYHWEQCTNSPSQEANLINRPGPSRATHSPQYLLELMVCDMLTVGVPSPSVIVYVSVARWEIMGILWCDLSINKTQCNFDWPSQVEM